MIASIRKPNSAGLVVTTAGNDLVHTLGANRSGATRTAIIKKILAYNNTGGNVTLQFGTQDNAVAPAFVQLLPELVAINGLENVWTEDGIPAVEFSVDTTAGAAGAEGNVYVLASAAGVNVRIEVEEYGA